MGLAGKGKAATLPLTKPARTFACVFAWFFASFNELAFYGFGSALAAGARVFSPTHPPFCFWDRERSGAGGMQHSGSERGSSGPCTGCGARSTGAHSLPRIWY